MANGSEMFKQARLAQAEWAKTSYRERARILLRVRDRLLADADAIARTISMDNGKTELDALATEVLPAAMAIGFYARAGKDYTRAKRIRGGNIALFNKKSYLHYEPWGVVGIISPWNYPFSIPFSEVIMALLMGNAVILKVASDTPQVAAAIVKCFEGVGLPAGLFSLLNLPGKEAGKALIENRVDKLFFTGSVQVGKELMAMASEKLIPVVLELGGADAAIICEDADLALTAGGILWAGFSNAGQSCAGVQRVLIHENIYDEFAALLAKKVAALRVGSGLAPDTDMGPLISPRQRDTVRAQVDECIRMGAKVLAAGSIPDGAEADKNAAWYPATILADCPPDSPIMAEEVFGPVVGLVKFTDEAEAIRLANSSSMGLTASVWSRDRKRARALAAQIEAGSVMINDHLMSHGLAETPWGGYRDSGIGLTHSRLGLEEMLRVKTVIDDSLPFRKRNIFWHPYSRQVYEGLKSIIIALYAKKPGQRLKALPGLVRIFFRYFI